MFNFFKAKKSKNAEVTNYESKQLRNYEMSYEMQKIIHSRAMAIIENDNAFNVNADLLFMVADTELLFSSRAIYWKKATIDDVIKFADNYGCTVDYLLGRTDTPYYTL